MGTLGQVLRQDPAVGGDLGSIDRLYLVCGRWTDRPLSTCPIFLVPLCCSRVDSCCRRRVQTTRQIMRQGMPLMQQPTEAQSTSGQTPSSPPMRQGTHSCLWVWTTVHCLVCRNSPEQV